MSFEMFLEILVSAAEGSGQVANQVREGNLANPNKSTNPSQRGSAFNCPLLRYSAIFSLKPKQLTREFMKGTCP